MAIYKVIKRLPIEYQEVEYIENTGGQYIVTNFIPSTTSFMEAKAQFTIAENKIFVGSRQDISSAKFTFGVGNGVTQIQESFGNSAVNQKVADFDLNWHNYKMDRNHYYLDGVEITRTEPAELLSAFKVYIGACNQGDTPNFADNRVRISNVKLGDNNIIKHNYVPCYRKSDNEIGLYDTVNNEFYINAGTGTFLKGHDVKVKQIKSIHEGINGIIPKEISKIYKVINNVPKKVYEKEVLND